jgi:prepilin-type N-terminal cleavage/methylation domain-containing protein
MLKINKNKAFSLIELSIVILIIGILVAGVTQSSRLINQMKLTSARSLTLSSPIPSIKDIYAWYESTMEKSFDEAEASDGLTITNWYDLNPQVSSGKINFVQGNAGFRPTYQRSSINGLPAIYFNGSKFLNTDINTPSLLGSGSATFFFVFRPQDISDQRWLITQTYATCVNNIEIGHTAGNVTTVKGNFGIHSGCFRSTVTNPVIMTNNEALIVSMVVLASPIVSGSTANVKIFKNGGNELAMQADNGGYNTALGGSYARENYSLYIGTRYDWRSNLNNYYAGTIGEVIIYSRSLNTEERQSVEKYLGKKWGIVVQ